MLLIVIGLCAPVIATVAGIACLLLAAAWIESRRKEVSG